MEQRNDPQTIRNGKFKYEESYTEFNSVMSYFSSGKHSCQTAMKSGKKGHWGE